MSKLERLNSWWGPRSASEWKDEILASLVVCFAQIPESVAFAALAHCKPPVGLHAAWIVGLICALGGGRPGMINGSAGALASVTCNFVAVGGSGVEELFVSVIGAGVITLIAGAFQVGRFLSLVPATVMIGFCNGLAIVIGRAQLDWFKDLSGEWLEGDRLFYTLVHCGCAFLLMVLMPRITRKFPASLLAIIVGICLENFYFVDKLGVSTVTIGDKSRFERKDSIPIPFFFDSQYDLNNIRSVQNIMVQSATLALVAMLESLMTLEVMNDLTHTLGKPNQQVWALGVANICAGLFGTMGGNSLIELSVMNVQAGGTLRASAVLVALGVLMIILFASPVLNLIPSGCLAGIMVIVVMDTAKWSSFPAMFASLLPPSVIGGNGRLRKWLRGLRIQKYDAFVIILVTATTALSNLAVAVFLGMFFACIRFAWQSQQPFEVVVDDNGSRTQDCKMYYLKGNLFFAAKDKLSAAFTPDCDPPVVEIDFAKAVIYDFSVMYVFHPIMQRYAEKGIEVRIYNLHDATHLHHLLRVGDVKNAGAREPKFQSNLSLISAASGAVQHNQNSLLRSSEESLRGRDQSAA